MLNVLLGKDWVCNRDAILHRIASDVSEQRGSRILLVPDSISHETERTLCKVAGDTTSRFAEVLTFTQLVSRVEEYTHTGTWQCLDNGGRVVAMASAARQLHSKLKAYASVETKPEFLSAMVEMVDELKRNCITAGDLQFAALQTEGVLAQKLEELALLLDTYDGLCSHSKRDPSDQMVWLLEALQNTDYAQKHVFYIDGFTDFSRQHLAIVSHILCVSPSVTIALNCERPGDSHLAYEKAGETAAVLLRLAKEANVPVETQEVLIKPSPLAVVRDSLFQGPITLQTQLREKLSLFRAASVYEECLGAAQSVLEAVHCGMRYKDIQIVCTDLALYREPLNLIFQKSAIPSYLSGKEEVLQKTVIGSILTALEVALDGFETEAVLRYMKSAISPLDLDTCDLVENYVLLWGIRGSKWLDAWENHPDGLNGVRSVHSDTALEKLNRARELLTAPLAHLRNEFRSHTKLCDQIRGLYGFFQEIRLPEKLRDLADSLEMAGDRRGSQILHQLWEILLSAMEQLYDVLGNTVWDADVFTRLFTLLLSQYDVGTIPAVLDSVMVGSPDVLRFRPCKYLIVLGAAEGLMPGYYTDSGILNGHERDALRQLGVPLPGGSMDGMQLEFSRIYGVFCGARNQIRVFCSATEPSYIYKRLAALVGGDTVYVPDYTRIYTDVQDASSLLIANHMEHSADALGFAAVCGEVASRCKYERGSMHPHTVQSLYGSCITMSASQIDKLAGCRFAYYLQYGLRAKERKEASVDPAEYGTYVHAVLEHTAEEVMASGGFHVLSLADTVNIAKKHSDTYIQEQFHQIASPRLSYLMERNWQELEMIVRELWEELHISHFTPAAFELGFGDREELPAIPIHNGKLQAQLRGYVDRVDVWQENGCNYFRVVDYKTGSKDFDYCDIYNGIGLQMLLYLYALEQSGAELIGKHPIGAGVQYFSARSPMLSSDGKLSREQALESRSRDWKRKGLLLSEKNVLLAMAPEEGTNRLSCTIRKDGTVSGDIADRDEFRLLKRHIDAVLESLVEDVASGNVEPNPYTRGTASNVCSYCPYQSICHMESVPGRRNYRAMTGERFWNEIKKVKQNG